MIVGIPRELMEAESRVGATPQLVRDLVADGHTVRVESLAGLDSGFDDVSYRAHGAQIVSASEAWDVDLVVKVKEPQSAEFDYFNHQVVMTYFHLAAHRRLAQALVSSDVTAVSYDTVQTAEGALPLLAPMSALAGHLAMVEASHLLLNPHGGTGVVLDAVAGTDRAHVVIVGAGVAGSHALALAVAMGAQVTVFDVNVERLAQVAAQYDDGDQVECLESEPGAVAQAVARADVVVGAVLVPGTRAPRVITHDMVMSMRPGAVVVDIAIDQGGCCEDATPTTHADPAFQVGPARLYCVANMPGAAGRSATEALTRATGPYVCDLARRGMAALEPGTDLHSGVNVARGGLVHPAVREAFTDLPAVEWT